MGSCALRSFFPTLAFIKGLCAAQAPYFVTAKEQIKQLLDLIIDATAGVVVREFERGDRDFQGLSQGAVRHAVRKLKQLTDIDYDHLRREAEEHSEKADASNMGGHSSESSATEEYRRHREILDFHWPDDVLSQVGRLNKSTLSIIVPRFRSRGHQGFRPRSESALAAWDGTSILRAAEETARAPTRSNKEGLSLHATRKSTQQFLDERKVYRSATGDRSCSPARTPLSRPPVPRTRPSSRAESKQGLN